MHDSPDRPRDRRCAVLRDPWYLALALVAALSAACLIGRRSDEFACSTSEECPPDRSCSKGFCIVPECPEGCTCGELLPDRSGYAECTIDCSGNRCRNETITCPAGMACTVRCDNSNDCERVDCSQATSCSIACTASGSCADGVTCGPGACQVACTGAASCAGGVSCSSSCRCDVMCNSSACATPASCPPDLACDSGLGCISSPGGTCNRCI